MIQKHVRVQINVRNAHEVMHCWKYCNMHTWVEYVMTDPRWGMGVSRWFIADSRIYPLTHCDQLWQCHHITKLTDVPHSMHTPPFATTHTAPLPIMGVQWSRCLCIYACSKCALGYALLTALQYAQLFPRMVQVYSRSDIVKQCIHMCALASSIDSVAF